MPYQNAKERLSMSTLRIGTDVNIHCKLLDCTSPPKNPKIPPKKKVKKCPIISTSPSEPNVQNSLN